MHKLLVLIAATLLHSSTVHAAQKYALLIGVARYEHARMNEPDALKFPETDAAAMGELLESGGYEVEQLLGKAATRTAIQKKLEALTDKADTEGVVLVGVFGRGLEHEKLGRCFCPVDARVHVIKDSEGRTTYDRNNQPLTQPDPESLVKVSDVLDHFKWAKAGRHVLIWDVASITRPPYFLGGSQNAAFDFPERTAVLFSCNSLELPYEYADWNGGPFAMSLLKQIPLIAEDGAVTMETLSNRVWQDVTSMVRDQTNGRASQTPLLWCTESVDLQWQIPAPKSQKNKTQSGD